MTEVVTDTGTYSWNYNWLPVPPHGNYLAPTPSDVTTMSSCGASTIASASDASSAGIAAQAYLGSGTTIVISDVITATQQTYVPYIYQVIGPTLVQSGTAYSSGTCQIYSVLVQVKASTIWSDTEIREVVRQNPFWVYYAPVDGGTPDIPPQPGAEGGGEPLVDVTMQLARSAGNIYTCQNADIPILPKYSQANGGEPYLRATFSAGTRIAVIRTAINSGFLIYEEIASVPSGNVYVYNMERRLIQVVDAAFISQYLA